MAGGKSHPKRVCWDGAAVALLCNVAEYNSDRGAVRLVGIVCSHDRWVRSVGVAGEFILNTGGKKEEEKTNLELLDAGKGEGWKWDPGGLGLSTFST